MKSSFLFIFKWQMISMDQILTSFDASHLEFELPLFQILLLTLLFQIEGLLSISLMFQFVVSFIKSFCNDS